MARKATLRSELRAVRRSAIRTSILTAMLLSGVSPAVFLWWSSGDGETSLLSHAQQMWSVALQTYPLTFAVALITLSRRLKWFRWSKWFFAASVIVVGAGIGNVVSHVSGNADQIVQPAQIFDKRDNPLIAIPTGAVNYLAGYADQYGMRMFLSSLLIGSFAGRIASRLIVVLPAHAEEAAELATQEAVQKLRRAA